MQHQDATKQAVDNDAAKLKGKRTCRTSFVQGLVKDIDTSELGLTNDDQNVHASSPSADIS